ncbi:MAG: PEP/pyruvate-binding domain-containing protein [Deltaproteobacteria bacterium]|nr:PEP/pyruvate-binding domain-containing protein [Deltaproteobacteria bacterium]
MISTGLIGLDKVLSGLALGDNVVWQIDAMDDYADFVRPFVNNALIEMRKVVYIRFASHKPILEKNPNITLYELSPSVGFESFSTEVNNICAKEGERVFYVFDCLSDLLSVWSNDLMIGNFFKVTCPYLFELDTIAYFALLRNRHSFKTVARIRDTTQILIDVYHDEDNYYVHPLKVWNRYSPTMFLPHIKQVDRFVPIANSVDTAKLFSHVLKKEKKSTKQNLDYWDRLFLEAEDAAGREGPLEKRKGRVEQLCKIVVSRDDKLSELARNYLTLEDLLNIKSRMIGTGFIGGKAAGMLIARNILLSDKSFEADQLFEPHDSFYIGADVFYTYIVENGWWKLRMKQRTKEGYFDVAKELRKKLLNGIFPEEIKEQFQEMIEYFGQAPIIVRSSSLLEDGYGGAFAGKYESIFLTNQGAPEERYAKFVDAVRQVYASTMNESALVYRLQRGLHDLDEQMALLVQRVSGSHYSPYFFPDVAGVGISYNTFVWKNTMDPTAGMLRLVLGLGTRAVNRVEGDYPRIVALDMPLLRAHAGMADTQKFSQHEVDVLNIRKNLLETVSLRELLKKNVGVKLDWIAVRDDDATRELKNMGIEEDVWVLTFDELLSKTSFCDILTRILKTLEKAYQYPVDIEFTVNFKKNGEYQLNLLQCRPVRTKGLGRKVEIPKGIPKNNILFKSSGYFLGGNLSQKIQRIIYVDPKAYSELPTQSARYDIARCVGELNREIKDKEKMAVMLLGPGRWGTSTPSLGVPVSFAEISNITVLGEIAFATSNSIPELSFGTHFFQDLVETGIFYLALFPVNKNVYFHQAFFDSIEKPLAASRSRKKYEHVIKVFNVDSKNLRVIADIVSQKVICFFS